MVAAIRAVAREHHNQFGCGFDEKNKELIHLHRQYCLCKHIAVARRMKFMRADLRNSPRIVVVVVLRWLCPLSTVNLSKKI